MPILEACVKIEEGPYKAEGFNTYPLSKFTFRDGEILFEAEQRSIWDSGPHIFTCLADEHGNHLLKSEWSESELSVYMGDIEIGSDKVVDRY